MYPVSARFVPRLSPDDLFQRSNDENLDKNIITNEQTWVYGSDVETKQQSSDWKSPASPLPQKKQDRCTHE
jgi:hypothetical protein